MNTHSIFLDVAETISQMSHCVSHKVGAILVKDKRIISTGYNGTPKGFLNCDEVNTNTSREKHHEFSEMFEIHAELNEMYQDYKNSGLNENSSIYEVLKEV